VFPGRFDSERVVLRPIAVGDAEAIFSEYAQDPEVVRFLIWRPHRSLADTEAYIAGCLAASAEKERTYALTERAGGALIGAFALRRRERHALDCGYVLARRCWGRGLMSEALSAVTGWAMVQPTIWRFGAVCDIDNRASARVMEKAGMQREGILRRWILHPNISDEPRDCFSYAITR
jgi:ribosomal-protein-alanine N-acetyltransferase